MAVPTGSWPAAGSKAALCFPACAILWIWWWVFGTRSVQATLLYQCIVLRRAYDINCDKIIDSLRLIIHGQPIAGSILQLQMLRHMHWHLQAQATHSHWKGVHEDLPTEYERTIHRVRQRKGKVWAIHQISERKMISNYWLIMQLIMAKQCTQK